MSADTKSKLSPLTITLHWIVAIMMIALVSVGLYMEQNEAYSLYPWHKSFGVLILLFVVLRVLWRFKNGWPPHVGEYSSWEQRLSKVVHWLLIIGTIMMPVSGMMMSGLGGYGIPFFGFDIMAFNPDPANPGQALPINEGLAGFGHQVHEMGTNVLIAAFVLHVLGALKHELVDKDGTLRRMLGARV